MTNEYRFIVKLVISPIYRYRYQYRYRTHPCLYNCTGKHFCFIAYDDILLYHSPKVVFVTNTIWQKYRSFALLSVARFLFRLISSLFLWSYSNFNYRISSFFSVRFTWMPLCATVLLNIGKKSKYIALN